MNKNNVFDCLDEGTIRRWARKHQIIFIVDIHDNLIMCRPYDFIISYYVVSPDFFDEGESKSIDEIMEFINQMYDELIKLEKDRTRRYVEIYM